MGRLRFCRGRPVQSCGASFDHLVRGEQQLRWHLESERLGRLQIYAKLQLGRKLDRQIARPAAFQNSVDEVGGTPEVLRNVDAVAHQPAPFDMLAEAVDGG